MIVASEMLSAYPEAENPVGRQTGLCRGGKGWGRGGGTQQWGSGEKSLCLRLQGEGPECSRKVRSQSTGAGVTVREPSEGKVLSSSQP